MSTSTLNDRKRMKRSNRISVANNCILCHDTHKSTLDLCIENLELDSSPSSSSSLIKVFSCHQILKLILLPLSISTLLTCRLVNLEFRDVATKILRGRKSLHLDFIFDSTVLKNCFILNDHHHHVESELESETKNSPQTNSNKKTLYDLNTLLISSTSTSFPCSSFSFSLVGTHLEDEALQFFLDIYGYNIKRMKIHLPDDEDEEEYSSLFAFRRLLKLQAPHLEFLDISPIPNEWSFHPEDFLFSCIKQEEDEEEENTNDEYTNLIRSRNQLPHLKHLLMWPFNTSNLILLEILKAARNLEIFGRDETFFDLDVSAIDHFICTGKTTCIKNVNFMPDFDEEEEILENLQNLEKFGDSQLQIKRIKIFLKNIWSAPHFFERVGQILSKILEKSKNSLEEMTIYQSIGFLGNSLKLPEFISCQTLKICLFDENSEEEEEEEDKVVNSPRYFPYHIFPLDFNFIQSFPNVQKLQLEFSQDEEGNANRDFPHEWDNYFPPSLKIEMLLVCYLELDYLPLIISSNISKLIPNVQFLQIKKPIKNFNRGGKFIWQNFTQLKSLKLSIDVDSLEGNSIDSAVTGFSVEQCKILQRNFVSPSEIKEKSPSILNLKYLREICLIFTDESEGAKDFYSLMTNVSFQFGVKEMPDLSLKISVQSCHSENKQRMKNSLNSLRPFISSLDLD